MKIAIVSHDITKGDGQGRVNYELVRYLLAQGVDVHLLADRVAPDLVEQGATWIPVHPRTESIHLIKVWKSARMVDRLLNQIGHRFDIILACGVTLNRAHTVNVAHFVHGTWLRSPYHASRVRPGLNGLYQWLYSAINARWERHTFEQADTAVAVSEMVRQELIDIGVPPEKITVIVNGVNSEEFAPGAAERKVLGLPEDVPLGLFVGDIQSPIKNLDTVLHALTEVPGVHLAVAGAIRRSPYPALAEKLEIADRVHFLGFRRDIPDLMKAADFFVLASRRDSCPLVLLEAMASGLPVITARTVGSADLVGTTCGFVLQGPDDRATLLQGLRTLAFDPATREEMGRAARRVAEAHSWDQMSERYMNLFTEIYKEKNEKKAIGVAESEIVPLAS